MIARSHDEECITHFSALASVKVRSVRGVMSTLGERLKRALAERGISQAALARDAKLPYRSVQSYVADQQKPGAEALVHIKRVLGLSLDWLLTGEGEPFPESAVLERRPFELRDFFDLHRRYTNVNDVIGLKFLFFTGTAPVMLKINRIIVARGLKRETLFTTDEVDAVFSELVALPPEQLERIYQREVTPATPVVT